MARQKCVMNAMLHQLSPKTVVLKFGDIAKASQALITTDLPQSEVDTFMQLALKARSDAGAHRLLRAAPDLHRQPRHRQDPRRRQEGHRLLRGQDGQEEGHVRTRSTPVSTTTNGGGSIGNLRQGYAANQAEDLSSVC